MYMVSTMCIYAHIYLLLRLSFPDPLERKLHISLHITHKCYSMNLLKSKTLSDVTTVPLWRPKR